MPRKKKATKPDLVADAAIPQEITAITQPIEAKLSAKPVVEATSVPPEPAPTIYAADPRPVMTVNLCGYSGGPAMHLLRSYRFKQMQVRFEQGQPDEQYLTMLKRSGWLDRTESEGVWTKQIDPNARWQSVDRMEQEFKAIANAIRKDRGLEPVLERLALA